MNARAHRDSVNALVFEIKSAHTNQTPLPINIISQLLPLQSDQLDDVEDRGVFEFDGDSFTNEADGELWIEFYDPVLEEFSATLPAVWKGAVDIQGKSLRISFSEPIPLEISKIATIGINRSSFQSLASIVITPKASVSRLIDGIDEDKETFIVAELEDFEEDDIENVKILGINETTETYGERVANAFTMLAAEEDDCGCGPCADEPDWYVYRKRTGITCFTHSGTIVGAPAYDRLYGPDTKAACDNWINNHPEQCQ